MPARSSGWAAQFLTVRPRLLVLATHRRERFVEMLLIHINTNAPARELS